MPKGLLQVDGGGLPESLGGVYEESAEKSLRPVLLLLRKGRTHSTNGVFFKPFAFRPFVIGTDLLGIDVYLVGIAFARFGIATDSFVIGTYFVGIATDFFVCGCDYELIASAHKEIGSDPFRIQTHFKAIPTDFIGIGIDFNEIGLNRFEMGSHPVVNASRTTLITGRQVGRFGEGKGIITKLLRGFNEL